MTLHRYAARRDDNEAPLIRLANRLGANVVLAGPMDFWIGYRGKWTPCEVKAIKGRYTPYQVSFLKRCKDNNLPVWTWHTVDDVLKDLGAK